MNYFRDYKTDGHNWITLSTGEYYPDILPDACKLYTPVLVLFSKLLSESESSKALLINIAQIHEGWMRVQLARVFRKYVSPETPVEMLKKKTKAGEICEQFGDGFRPIHIVQAKFNSRPIPDEALCTLLWEYKDRGKKGYDLTEKFFNLMRAEFSELTTWGPERAGNDIMLGSVFKDYPNPKRPVDFIISDRSKENIYCVGLARYDGDRGGAQEDDRTGGYTSCADEVLSYAQAKGLNLRVLFLNDGPGLLLGSMWDDYSKLEERWNGKIKVVTLRMITERLTLDWLKGLEDGDGNS